MDLNVAEEIARGLILEHLDEFWEFEWDRAKSRAGATHFKAEKITLSRYLIGMNDEAFLRETVLHEIAHGLVGKVNGQVHGPEFMRALRAIGGKGGRVAFPAARPPKRYQFECPTHGRLDETIGFNRMPKGTFSHNVCGKSLKMVDTRTGAVVGSKV